MKIFFFAFSSPLNTVLNFHQHHQPVFFYYYCFFSARIWDSIICDPTRFLCSIPAAGSAGTSSPQRTLPSCTQPGYLMRSPASSARWTSCARTSPGSPRSPGPGVTSSLCSQGRSEWLQSGQQTHTTYAFKVLQQTLLNFFRKFQKKKKIIFLFLHFYRHAILKACCRPWTFNI